MNIVNISFQIKKSIDQNELSEKISCYSQDNLIVWWIVYDTKYLLM